MSHSQKIDAMLRTIGQALGQSLALEPDGTLTLEFAGDRRCHVALLDGTAPELALSARLSHVADEDRLHLFRLALHLNLNFESKGTIIGYDALRRDLVLTMKLAVEPLTVDDLAAGMTAFMHQVLRLAKELVNDPAHEEAISGGTAARDVSKFSSNDLIFLP